MVKVVYLFWFFILFLAFDLISRWSQMYLMVLKSVFPFSRNGGVSRDFICTKCIIRPRERFAGSVQLKTTRVGNPF